MAKTLKRKGVKNMESKYDVPELRWIGKADDVVMGSGDVGIDLPEQSAADFEFEQD
jgi:hypothetical protein